MALTDLAIRNFKPAEKPFKASDSGGLHLLVNPNGSRLWRLKYRFEGKEKLLALGAYPIVTLAKAREKRDEAKGLLADGIDPAKSRRESRIAAVATSGNTFRLVAGEYLDKLRREERAPATLAKVEWLLSFAYGDLGERPISEIAAAEVLAVLRKVEQRGRRESARRLRSTVGSVFRYAIATARAENDPTFALRGALVAPKVKHRAALIGTVQLGAFLRAIDSFDGQVTTRTALALLPLLFPRPGELRAAEWVEFDLDRALWTLPAARMKMRRPHRIPLPTQAVALLRELHLHTGAGRLVFPSVRSTVRSISENTLNAALRRMGYTTDEVTAHGFRATASTLLNESSLWNADAIERQLAHEDADAIRRAYARGEHWEERVRMMQWWADKLEEWKGEG
ncbi:tyrosine-type recombinase/integrase [Xanthobacter oligotrophicus]|uniref:tyrosine-type recombinase/integrase n=1 Tax=Xanthobacter oligotrophicus TaxID=2607286 RepID=UPI0011F37BD9|nr:integrase arm-type DNA-binding domain-containing protein [Xanthobacter oligotrophicus]MCG5234211.1 integrase arm-type DNA-binding domain-containing protein [Xanthobacter oligotrophicus]